MLSVLQAKAFIEPHFAKIAGVEAFLPKHIEAVARVARFMAEKDGINPDEAEAAGWVHDVGYIFGAKDHAANGLKFCQESKLPLSEGQADAIANHGTNATPATPLGRLMKLADKLSFLDFELVKDAYPSQIKALREQILPMIDKAILERL